MPERGEVWQVDFGITPKVRPALVVSIPYGDADRALIGVVPHTTATRGSQFEVPVPARFLGEAQSVRKGPAGWRNPWDMAIPPKIARNHIRR